MFAERLNVPGLIASEKPVFWVYRTDQYAVKATRKHFRKLGLANKKLFL